MQLVEPKICRGRRTEKAQASLKGFASTRNLQVTGWSISSPPYVSPEVCLETTVWTQQASRRQLLLRGRVPSHRLSGASTRERGPPFRHLLPGLLARDHPLLCPPCGRGPTYCRSARSRGPCAGTLRTPGRTRRAPRPPSLAPPRGGRAPLSGGWSTPGTPGGGPPQPRGRPRPPGGGGARPPP